MVYVWLEVVPLWRIREPVSALSHLAGALLGVLAIVVLVRRARQRGLGRRAEIRLAAYGASLVFAFTASTLFHFLDWPEDRLVRLLKIDHAAIFILIAGTCTAIYGAVRAHWIPWLLGGIWAAALGALVVKMLVWPMPLWLSALVYVAVGVGAMGGLVALRQRLDGAHWQLLCSAGGAFILGAGVFATEWPVIWPGHVEGHELFHFLVLIGAGLHFWFVYRYCTGPDLLVYATGRQDAPSTRT